MWGGMEEILMKAFYKEGALELSLEGNVGVYHVEKGERTFQA